MALNSVLAAAMYLANKNFDAAPFYKLLKCQDPEKVANGGELSVILTGKSIASSTDKFY